MPLEIWAGPECTLNRVADGYFDQLTRTGHDARISDLDLIADLGVRTVRYPALWERVEADGWSWTDARLERLRGLGIRPIAGLVHHGSGPPHTSLLDDAFPQKLAAYAGALARRHPWIDAYTPINEPLTTARFSALYGHWYPHAHDDRSFATALLIECRATVLAMQAIREVHPGAELIQTDDLGWTHATARFRYQADFENERRWLAWDLLCGTVDRKHPMHHWLRWVGIAQADIDWFREHRCPPEVIGVNYYVTSERFLDDDLAAWPASAIGGNGRDRYADVEAVRAGIPLGIADLLDKTWRRYHRRIAITEAHLGCTRDEQLRWLHEIWRAAHAARARGVALEAITAWSLFGAFDWHCLATRDEGRYEPGVFDVRSGTPRPTALAHMVKALCRGEDPAHPVLVDPGWWRAATHVREEAA